MIRSNFENLNSQEIQNLINKIQRKVTYPYLNLNFFWDYK